ncbi:MAG: outer membrane lipoprotein carrier protein LolA [Draconibacterium sp.]|nr:outer membrane lipoprotein carrier protein LolA [Draconibacterium sp.]
MMIRILLIISTLLFVNVIWAQEDAKAKKILDQVSEKTRTFNSISAEFTFSMINEEMEINEKNEGTIMLKGQKYCVQLPELGVEVYSDGVTLWNYMKDGNQVTISNIDEEGSELMDPSSLFTIYEKGFRSEFVADKKVGNTTIHHINLFPGSDEYDVDKIEVYINKSTLFIHSATLHGTDGNLYGIVVKKLETNQNFSDSDFVFNASKYPDVEEIDFR